jgi:hypothetical protein
MVDNATQEEELERMIASLLSPKVVVMATEEEEERIAMGRQQIKDGKYIPLSQFKAESLARIAAREDR